MGSDWIKRWGLLTVAAVSLAAASGCSASSDEDVTTTRDSAQAVVRARACERSPEARATQVLTASAGQDAFLREFDIVSGEGVYVQLSGGGVEADVIVDGQAAPEAYAPLAGAVAPSTTYFVGAPAGQPGRKVTVEVALRRAESGAGLRVTFGCLPYADAGEIALGDRFCVPGEACKMGDDAHPEGISGVCAADTAGVVLAGVQPGMCVAAPGVTSPL